MVIDNLEKRGLVCRQRDHEDRRFLTVHLTDQGSELIDRVFTSVQEAIVAEMARLSVEEQKTLGGLCKRLGLKECG